MEICTNYKSKKYYIGAKFKSRSNLNVEIIGKSIIPGKKYSSRYAIKFKDGSIGTASSDLLEDGRFNFPIIFSKGNNSTNKYKTIYKRYEFILSRCNDINAKDYMRYGGRGIKCKFKNIYELWFELINDEKINLLLQSPDLYEIDRIDNNDNYRIGNIRIVTCSQNQRNKKNNYIYNLINNKTEEILFTGIKIDCELWIRNNLNVKTSICMKHIKKEVGKKNGFSVRYEMTGMI